MSGDLMTNYLAFIRITQTCFFYYFNILNIDLQYKCNTKKIMTQKATRDIMGVTTQP